MMPRMEQTLPPINLQGLPDNMRRSLTRSGARKTFSQVKDGKYFKFVKQYMTGAALLKRGRGYMMDGKFYEQVNNQEAVFLID